MQDPNNRITEFQEIVKHTPKILREQLLLQLSKVFFDVDRSAKSDDATIPSIERFHGVLLFIDISGFTALSQKLTVDELQAHINDYFSIMLDIVYQYGGDVVKFAGDAIYVLWPTPLHALPHSTDNSFKESFSCDFIMAMKSSLEAQQMFTPFLTKAISCAVAITHYCNNYAVNIRAEHEVEQASVDGENSLSATHSIREKVSGSQRNRSSSTSTAYLNVHAGIGMGLMAGINVGAANRYEYILMGEPINDVAAAESTAKIGEIALCANVHEIFHGATGNCNCSSSAGGCFILSSSQGEIQEISSSSTRGDMKKNAKDLIINHRAVNQLIQELTKSCSLLFDNSYKEYGPGLSDAILKLIVNNPDQNPISHKTIMEAYSNADEPTAPLSSSPAAVLSQNVADLIGKYTYSSDPVVRSQFSRWIQKCLYDDLKKHVHEAARTSPDMFEPDR
jgi:class 3 adenylate cyclase